MHDAEPELAVAAAHGLGHLASFFPFLDVGEQRGFDVGADMGAQVMVEVGVVGVLDVELGEERFAVGGGWEARWRGHCGCLVAVGMRGRQGQRWCWCSN